MKFMLIIPLGLCIVLVGVLAHTHHVWANSGLVERVTAQAGSGSGR